MTRREFDAATRENWGAAGAMASDERAAYRERRSLPDRMERAELLTRREAYSRRTGTPALSRRSPFCAPALYAARLKWRSR